MTSVQSILSQLKGVRKSGNGWVARCPAHQDRNPSLSVATGRNQDILLYCFSGCSFKSIADALGLYGRSNVRHGYHGKNSTVNVKAPEPPPEPKPVRQNLTKLMEFFHEWLMYRNGPDEINAADYLEKRKITYDVALEFRIGYCRDWPGRSSPRGRIVFPHTNPAGDIINLYGRAIDNDIMYRYPKSLRHDHLPGNKGIFNAPALVHNLDQPLWICEGPFDALSAMQMGHNRAIALFGLSGFRENWFAAVRDVVIAFDGDGPGQKKALDLQGLLGRHVNSRILSSDHYGSHKDLNECLVAGVMV